MIGQLPHTVKSLLCVESCMTEFASNAKGPQFARQLLLCSGFESPPVAVQHRPEQSDPVPNFQVQYIEFEPCHKEFAKSWIK